MNTPDRPVDLKRRLEAEREGVPFLHFRDGDGVQRIVALDPAADSLTVGRDETCDVCLDWDANVSRVHARLERSGGFWTVYDGGLSRNGTFLNGERVSGHRLLDDGDEIRLGTTEVCFRDPAQRRARTAILPEGPAGPGVSPAQRRVLLALCRPYKNHPAFARPASNRDIAAELFLSIESVKSHLRALFAKFDLDELPQNEKRVRLVERAFQHGLVRDSEL
jgi:hypothetical protein